MNQNELINTNQSETINTTNTTSLVTEIFIALKHTIRNLWITVIILIMLLFITNLCWMYAWNLPTEVNTIEQEDISDSTVSGEINNGFTEN